MLHTASRVLVMLSVLMAAARGGESALTGRQVMEKARRANEPKDEIVQVEMRLIDKGGRVMTRRLRIEYLKAPDGLDRSLIRFHYPRRMKGKTRKRKTPPVFFVP